METIQWQNHGPDDKDEVDFHQNTMVEEKTMEVEKEEKETIQLLKYQDPMKDAQRQAYIALVENFGLLILDNNIEEIAKNLLTEDFEFFSFDSSEKTTNQYSIGSRGVFEHFRNMGFENRDIRETHVDVEKRTVCQVIIYTIKGRDVADHVVCEIFTINDDKISRLRIFSGCVALDGRQYEDPLEPTRRDKMLTKIKQINYALSGTPDIEKVGSLLDDDTEYKISRWGDSKCITFRKDDFTIGFRSLEAHMKVASIVPYELSADVESRYVSATYVYHLEEHISGKKFVWLNTCIYGFDQGTKLVKIVQQGETYPEGEVDIPFEVYSRKSLEERVHYFYTNMQSNLDMYYSDKFLFDCRFFSIFPSKASIPVIYHGLKNLDSLVCIMNFLKDYKADFIKTVDIYVDHHNESHDVAFALMCSQGPHIEADGTIDDNAKLTSIGILRVAFENGKMAKSLEIIAEIQNLIPSPFDDKTFSCMKIKGTFI